MNNDYYVVKGICGDYDLVTPLTRRQRVSPETAKKFLDLVSQGRLLEARRLEKEESEYY